MKNFTKKLSLILMLALFAFFALGSGSGSPSGSSSGGAKSSGSSATSTTKAEPDPTIEETLVYDQGGIKITAKSLDMSGFMGPAVKLLIENDSSKNVTVQARNTSVNGYMVDCMMSVDVAAGKKANDGLTFLSSDLTKAGITKIADLEFSFHIFDTDTWSDNADSDIVRLETSAFEGYEYQFDDSGDQVYKDHDVEIVVKGIAESDSWFGPGIEVYICNSGSRAVTVQTRDVSVNGFMVNTLFSSDVAAGKHALDTITFMQNELEENDIESLDTVELSFHIFDADSWDTIADTSPITLDFK